MKPRWKATRWKTPEEIELWRRDKCCRWTLWAGPAAISVDAATFAEVRAMVRGLNTFLPEKKGK